MTSPLIALYKTRIASEGQAERRNRLIRAAINCVDRAENGSGNPRVTTEMVPMVGTATRRTSFHYPGPRGGQAVVITIVGESTYADGVLALAADALDALVTQQWSQEDRIQIELVARACALLAYDAHPKGILWAGFPIGPTGPIRSEAMIDPMSNSWSPAVDLSKAVIADCPASILVDIDTPRNRGAIPHTITLSQNHALMQPRWISALTPIDRLRYAQLARLA